MTKIKKQNQDIRALADSIKHWERMVTGEDTDGSQDECALCGLYFEGHQCNGCPVSEDTGEELCKGSPYKDWEDEQGGDEKLQACYAEDELKYLRKLRKDLVARQSQLLAKRKKK